LIFSSAYQNTLSDEYQAVNIAFQADMTIILKHLGITSFTIGDVVCRSGSVIATGQVDVQGVNNNTNVEGDIDTAAADLAAQSQLSSDFRSTASGPMPASGDACADATYNTCDPNAQCTNGAVGDYPQVICSCNFGYTDLDPTVPGTQCQNQCMPAPNQPFCLNNAVCTPTNSSAPDCKCDQWHLGNRCENLNAGIVAAVVIGVLAGVLLMAVIFVVWRIRTHRMSKSSDFLSSIDAETKYSSAPPAESGGVEAKSYQPTSYDDV